MLRRKPTRIELKIDDLEEWYTRKKELESQKKSQQPLPIAASGDSSAFDATPDAKTKKEMIQQRIGYDPRPVVQPGRLPTHWYRPSVQMILPKVKTTYMIFAYNML